jgi:hypothetical protein
MEFNLTAEQKLNSLRETKRHMLNEVYGLLVGLGIDPDEFDLATWVPEEPPTGNEARVRSLLTNIARAEAKIAELS